MFEFNNASPGLNSSQKVSGKHSTVRSSTESLNNDLQLAKNLMIPKSAPMRGGPDASAGPVPFGGHIYSMHQGEELRKQKQLQQKAYFLELTRQVHEKKPDHLSFKMKSVGSEVDSSPQVDKFGKSFSEMVGGVPRYKLKYDIENHVGFGVNGSQILGGPLQRDETNLLKKKKEEQQREMQRVLQAQIEEKQKLKQYERNTRINLELQQEKKFEEELKQETFNEKLPNPNFLPKSFQDSAYDAEPVPNLVPTSVPNLVPNPPSNSIPSLVSNTVSEFQEPSKQDETIEYLKELCLKLQNEQSQLKDKITNQESVIQDLKSTKTQDMSTEESRTEKPQRTKNNTPSINTRSKRSTPKSRIPKPENRKVQHQIESAKIAAIEQKIENARKKREQNQTRGKSLNRNKKVNESNQPNQPKVQRMQSAHVPHSPSSPELPSSPGKQTIAKFPSETPMYQPPETPKQLDTERQNLDTAGNSYFIYPDSEGNFRVEDELDKFLQERDSKFKFESSQSLRDSPWSSCINFELPKRDTKPLVARQSGFPSHIFSQKKY